MPRHLKADSLLNFTLPTNARADTVLSSSAAEINDDAQRSYTTKMIDLCQLFRNHGLQLTFTLRGFTLLSSTMFAKEKA